MVAVINTNISSLNAQRNLNTSQTALSTSLQRLSSGLRINSANWRYSRPMRQTQLAIVKRFRLKLVSSYLNQIVSRKLPNLTA